MFYYPLRTFHSILECKDSIDYVFDMLGRRVSAFLYDLLALVYFIPDGFYSRLYIACTIRHLRINYLIATVRLAVRLWKPLHILRFTSRTLYSLIYYYNSLR
jgi:hypothetical protein